MTEAANTIDKPLCASLGEGKSGWLSPEGRLYKCGHREHWGKARDILEKRLNVGDPYAPEEDLKKIYQWIAMGSSCHGSSYVSAATGETGRRPYTEKQLAWFKRNYTKLDKEQQFQLNVHGRLRGWKPRD